MSKSDQIRAIRGMNDVLPLDSGVWLEVERQCAQLLERYGYRQIRTPILERTELFARSIGTETDIVAKEMYTFNDRNGDSLSLRPEGTASCVRAGIENGLFYNQLQRLWYIGPMFRHERPQKGRYRQFNQIGAECYGWSTPDIEAEMLSLIAQMFAALGLQKTHLQINSLGDQESRLRYRQALLDYLTDQQDCLDEDSRRRLNSNPLRILDSKNPQVQTIINDAPSIHDYLNTQSAEKLSQLEAYLHDLKIDYQMNSRLVRGLDYYNDTVFEWVTEDFGAQSTVCAGGRYDCLVEQLGGATMPSFGFAMGLERLIQILHEQQAAITKNTQPADVFIISVEGGARRQALVMQQKLALAGIRIQLGCGPMSMKNQFKRADKSGAPIALVLGEQEAQTKTVGLKPLRHRAHQQQAKQQQQTIPQNDVLNAVTNFLESL